LEKQSYREIPFNYTSADDAQVVRLLLGDETWKVLEDLRSHRVTGRSARLVMRFFGEVFIIRRNPFLYEELVDSPKRRRRFAGNARAELETVRRKSDGNQSVIELVDRCCRLLDEVENEIAATPRKRKAFRKVVGNVIGESNVFFDPFTRVGHATDATDWRLYLPFAVVCPDAEMQVPDLIRTISQLGYKLIPRGAGTGLTGGCVPVRPECVILNTEKLNRISGIREEETRGRRFFVLETEAGVITENAIRYASEHNLVFATDPTSAWASTIGGNIAENAGGKTAVLWGTAIDNLYEYRMIMPGGSLLLVRRRDHPMRKIEPSDQVVFDVYNSGGAIVRSVQLRGDEIRKPGLWKDITNKALGGLPAVQKEGTDGVITSAAFVLHRPYPLKRTYCLEFFGTDIDEAAEVILALAKALANRGREALMAFEHYVEEYVRSIGYQVKSPRSELPKAVLLVDMVGFTGEQLDDGHRRLSELLKSYPNTELFQAGNPREAERFWKDRKRLGAIAARTNAFKLNEDVVLPLEALAEFARFVEQVNIEEERLTQLTAIRRIRQGLEEKRANGEEGWLETKILKTEQIARIYSHRIRDASPDELRKRVHPESFLGEMRRLFAGFSAQLEFIRKTWEEERSRTIVIATHMHAGDGNVHVNIPVFSNDREMMKRAGETADRVMEKAVDLGGVVSGEHGIGFTKIKYLDQERIRLLSEYRDTVDPDRMMNPGKLEDYAVQSRVFTPSFNLLELEARILQHGSLEELSEMVAKCVRCGRCKKDCCVFYPSRNLFFHPRNKNLAVGALIEALLYNTQRSHSTRFELLRHLETIADHCTICHKCLQPCPVDIDTGEVSVLERKILQDRHYKRTTLPTRLALEYLENRSRTFNRLVKRGIIQWGSKLQRGLTTLAASGAGGAKRGRFCSRLQSPLPRVPSGTLWDLLPACGVRQSLLIHPGNRPSGTVFYFPGCGSERIHPDVSKAALFLLVRAGRRVVLPPPFLCCGFPARVNARQAQHSRMVLRNTIIFSQIREMFRYLSFESCIVTCGTCKEALEQAGIQEIFDSPLTDITYFLSETGLLERLKPAGGDYFYHPPCHDSLDGGGSDLIRNRFNADVRVIPHCCSEAGTLALSRPDISYSLLMKKSEAMREAVGDRVSEQKLLLTNCPACLQGLRRQRDFKFTVRHLATETALRIGGPGWEESLRDNLQDSELVTF